MDIAGYRTLRSLWEHHVDRQPDKLFLSFEDRAGTISRYQYGEFDAWVNQTARALQALGVQRGTKVNLHLNNCPEFLVAFLALAKLGAVHVPTNIHLTVDDLAYMVDHSDSEIIITEPAFAETMAAVRARCPKVRHALLARTTAAIAGYQVLADLTRAESTERPAARPQTDDDFAILYTSGTTARPKGVLLTQRNYLFGGEHISKGFRILPDDVNLIVLPLFHGNAQWYSTMTAITVGASIALMERFSASRYIDQARRHGATFGALFGAVMRMILAQPEKPTDRDHQLRLVIFAQSITEPELAEWDRRFGVPLLQIWGMTEDPGLPLANPLDDVRKNMSIGLVGLGYECRIVDEHGNDVPIGAVGQLVVRGVPGLSLMKGYYKDPEATAATIVDGWLQTGDNVRMDEEGYFYFVDRAKDMIKRSGENIAASEVENVLKLHPKIADAAVIGWPDRMRDEIVKAYVIVKEGETLTAEEVIAWCRPRLAAFKVPELVEFRTSFPRTPVGKIQKHLLRREAFEKVSS